MISPDPLSLQGLSSLRPRAQVSLVTWRETSREARELVGLTCGLARHVEDCWELLGVVALMKRAHGMERPVAVWFMGEPVPLTSHSQIEERLPASSTYLRVEARSDKGVIYDVYFEGSISAVLRRFAVIEVMLL